MIVYKNVCENCFNEEEIQEGVNSFVARVTTCSTLTEIKEINNKFRTLPDRAPSFCSKECFISWLKQNLYEDGSFQELEKEEN